MADLWIWKDIQNSVKWGKKRNYRTIQWDLEFCLKIIYTHIHTLRTFPDRYIRNLDNLEDWAGEQMFTLHFIPSCSILLSLLTSSIITIIKRTK